MDYKIVQTANGYLEYPVRDSDKRRFSSFIWEKNDDDESSLYLSGEEHTFAMEKMITIAPDQADICIDRFPFRLMIKSETLFIETIDNQQTLSYINGVHLDVETNPILLLQEGDRLLFDTVLITYYKDELVILADEQKLTFSLPECSGRGIVYEGFPRFKRSPRLIKRVPDKAIEIKRPPEKQQMRKGSLIQMIVPPLMMLVITAAVSIMMKRGLYVIVSMVTTVMTMIFTITKFYNEKKDCAEKEKKRLEVYEQYLLDKQKELYQARQDEADAFEYNHPSLKDIEGLIHGYSSRIYEKNANDEDFLSISLGNIHDLVSYEIKMDYDELKLERDELELEAKEIKESFSYLKQKPVIIDLKRTHLGIVGEKEHIHEQIKLIISQLTFAQSYHDFQIVTIFDEKYQDDFLWMNWYPHLKIRALNVCGSIYSERLRDQVLGSLTQILKDRKLKQEEQKKESRFLPHFLFVIDEPKLIMDHSIMEYLDQNGAELGFSIIYTTHIRANLPEYINTIFLLNDSQQGTLLLEEKRVVNQVIPLNHIGDVNLEWMARDLSVLIHEQGITSHIPESITFFEMYKITNPNELQSQQRWKTNESHKTLAVPLGVRAEEDYVSLNLHEKAHGPHGLVAGTTGSGKSEIVQSYILSLAVNFHPYEVGFLLIDYKGGGMAGLFKDLPHLLGTITNLDGSESLRAMASIKSELARRQRIFSANNVNHINAYNQLFKNGEVNEPIPHLFLISDEFAELKKEQPEFMSELVSTARIGRSLGIHLILATQKPTGVVDDQIWTNSKFKLALKVQNEADSREILKTPDAANITQAGRAYLQVGNNEIYELFQSAWSGATYQEDGEKKEKDNRVWLVNDLGQGELLNDDLSSPIESNQLKATQLDVTVSYLKEVFEAENTHPVKRPWLPSLPYLLISAASDRIASIAAVQSVNLNIALGMVDIPEEQLQQECLLDLKEDGNIAYFGSAGFGKTTFLMTATISLAIQNAVERLNFYILDFGNSGLILLNGLPHTADYIQMDDVEKLNKFVRLIQDEIKSRKKLLSKQMAQNFDVYNQIADEPLKAIVIVVDNFDVVKELGFDMEEYFTKLSRDGSGLGIYMIITATRGAGVRYSTLNNFKNKIAGFLFDDTEANTLVGRSSYKLPEVKGRALVNLVNVNVMQIYSMVIFENEIEYNAKIRDLISIISEGYPGRKAPKIPVLPEQFVVDMIDDYEKDDRVGDVFLGLDVETVELRGFKRSQTPFVIIGESGKGKTNTLKVILEQVLDGAKVFLFDSKAMGLYDYEGEDIRYVHLPDEFDDFCEEIKELCEHRRNERKKIMEQEKGIKPQECYSKMQPCYILIDDIDDFIELSGTKPELILPIFKDAVDSGLTMIITVGAAKLKGYDELSRWVKVSSEGLVLSGQGILNIFPVANARENPVMGEGLLFHNGTYRRILLPQCDF